MHNVHQVEKLVKEREEALKDKERTRRVLEDLRKKYEADFQSAAPESRSTGLFAKQKKKKSKTMKMTSPVSTLHYFTSPLKSTPDNV